VHDPAKDFILVGENFMCRYPNCSRGVLITLVLTVFAGCSTKKSFYDFADSVNKGILVSQGVGGGVFRSVSNKPEEALLGNEQLKKDPELTDMIVVRSEWMDGEHAVEKFFDKEYHLREIRLDGRKIWDIEYSDAGKITRLGPLLIKREQRQDGTRLVSSVVGIVRDEAVYDRRGAPISYEVFIHDDPIMRAEYAVGEPILDIEEETAQTRPKSAKEQKASRKIVVNLFGLVVRVKEDGSEIVSYERDDNGRIIAQQNSDSVRRYVYQDGEKVLAIFGEHDQPEAVFGYALHPRVPDLMKVDDQTLRLIRDRDGSIRLAVDIDSGEVVFRRRYNYRGEIVEVHPADILPFGYKGGIYDAKGGLIHFGTFAYDTKRGRGYEPHDRTAQRRAPRHIEMLSMTAHYAAPLCVCGTDIAVSALAVMGSDAWAAEKERANFPKGASKCNLFTAERAQAVGAYVPLINGWAWPYNVLAPFADSYPPVAAQWARPDLQILGWEVVSPHEGVQIGDLIAENSPTENTTGHVAIVSAPATTVGTIKDKLIGTSDWGFRPDQKVTVRRYSGLDGPGCECPEVDSGTTVQSQSVIMRR
jgi:YD repeat-containing protein